MNTSQIASLLADEPVVKEIASRIESPEGWPGSANWPVSPETIRGIIATEGPTMASLSSRPLTEAIIRLIGRPPLLIRNDTFDLPDSDEWKNRLYPTKSKIERAIRSVGRVELLDHPSHEWVGTAWVVAENVVITNRHVALTFAYKKGRRFVFSQNPEGRTIRVNLDFKEEHRQNAQFEASVDKVIFIEELGDANPDLALLRLKKRVGLPDPIPLSDKARPAGHLIAAIGYPAWDDRNDLDAMARIFNGIYNVKRLSPGTVATFLDEDPFFTHDCSTLGGNSGSAIIDIETGEAIGLHYAGNFRKANYALKASVILKALGRLRIAGPVAAIPGPVGAPAESLVAEEGALAEEAPRVQDYADRDGYQEDFLGSARGHRLPLPTRAAGMSANGAASAILPYRHFSIEMNTTRKMALYTASNIDGRQLRRIPRSRDRWLLDPRLPRHEQTGEDVYADNDIDRGHLVRRLDPVWGMEQEAQQANADTFHFTNATPQHKDFNQKTWNDLEDYVLDNANAHELKLSVFTGPVFRDDDHPYRSVRLPRQFWKIVAMVKADGRKLSATGYLLSQADLLTNLEFAFGQFRTYQVPIARIESLTGLSFGKLRDFDPIGRQEGIGFRQIAGPEDIVF